jgi:hypothetical protein
MSSKATNRPWLGKTQFTFSCARLSATEVLGRSLIVVELPRMKKANSGRPIRFRKSSYLTEKRVSLLHTRHFGRADRFSQIGGTLAVCFDYEK